MKAFYYQSNTYCQVCAAAIREEVTAAMGKVIPFEILSDITPQPYTGPINMPRDCNSCGTTGRLLEVAA